MTERQAEIRRGFQIGNALKEGNENKVKGWFVGHFVGSEACLQRSDAVEVKWGSHKAGESKTIPVFNQHATSLSLLISGRFSLIFTDHDETVVLKQPGDYVIFAPRVAHAWVANEDTTIVTVRWPSLDNDQHCADNSRNT